MFNTKPSYQRRSSPPNYLINLEDPNQNKKNPISMSKQQWFKQWQSGFYSFIFSKPAMAIILLFSLMIIYQIFVIISLILVSYTGENYVEPFRQISPFCQHCSNIDFNDNIRSISMESTLCYEPMDIIYTWVNGSDPNLKLNIDKYKNKYISQQKKENNPNWTQPISIKIPFILHGGQINNFQDKHFDTIKKYIEIYLKQIANNYWYLIKEKPLITTTKLNNSLTYNLTNNNNKNNNDASEIDSDTSYEYNRRRLLLNNNNQSNEDILNETNISLKSKLKNKIKRKTINITTTMEINVDSEDISEDNVSNEVHTANINVTVAEVVNVTMTTTKRNVKDKYWSDIKLWDKISFENNSNFELCNGLYQYKVEIKESVEDINEDWSLIASDESTTTTTTTTSSLKPNETNITVIETTKPMEVILPSLCIQIMIDIIHEDDWNANQTLIFLNILENNESYWKNMTRDMTKELKEANKIADKLDSKEYNFTFNNFIMYPNISFINITKLNYTSEKGTGGKGRYRDNNEMIYSLRSVWKYAPWVRNIFIVTNGQVPNWLNLDNPKIKLITHEDIYRNKSHLPVFASPSIEANIHRIPGLSRRFIYLNDDVMFGNYIYPDDFWKLDGTQYFYPSWEVPRCSDGCPSNWIGDGYCDSACNSIECDFDGGDCKNGKDNKNRDNNDINNNNDKSKEDDKYCANGCPINWIGDKVCDKACSNKECAYDGGDCGLTILQENKVYSIQFKPNNNNTKFKLDKDIFTFYIDFNNIFPRETTTTTTTPTPSISDNSQTSSSSTTTTTKHENEGKITSASHDHDDMVRTAIVTQNEKILTVILAKHDRIEDEEIVTFDIGGYINGEEIHYIFDIQREAPPKVLTPEKVKNKLDDIWKNVNKSQIINETEYKLDNTTVIMPLVNLFNKSRHSDNNKTLNAYYLNLLKLTENHLYTFIQKLQSKKIKVAYNKWLIREANLINKTISELNESKKSKELKTVDKPNDKLPKIPTLSPVTILWEDDLYEYINPEDENYKYQSGDEDWYQRRRLLSTKNNQKYINDNDYKLMINLGLINSKGKWLISKSFNDWDFIHENELLNKEYNDEIENPIIIPGYINSNNDYISSNNFNSKDKKYIQSIKLKKEKELVTLFHQDIILLSHKLINIFHDNNMIPFPWLINELSLYILQQKEIQSTQKPTTNHQRKLLDTFGDSLRFVHRLYNKHFGSESRYVPAHMPHAIDKEILLEMIDKFSLEFSGTSSHKFRSSKDMQWSFSYFYFMMNIKYNFTSLDFIYENYLDLDGDTYLNKYEEDRLINDILLKKADMNTANETVWKEFFHDALWNITYQLHDLTYWHPLKITKFSLNYTTIARDYIIKYFNDKHKFKSSKKELDDVEFYMLKDNPTEVKDRLDNIYNKKPKFICINDDMDHYKDPSNKTLNILTNFFYKYYPYPSPFELKNKNIYHKFYNKSEMILNNYWKNEWNWNKGIFNDRIQTKIALKKNMFKSNKLQYTEHRYFKSFSNKNNNNNNTNNKMNVGIDIKKEKNEEGQELDLKEKIRRMVYTQFIVRISGLNKYLQMIVIFIVSTVIVLTLMYIWDLFYFWISTTFIWIGSWSTTQNNDDDGNGDDSNDGGWKSFLKDCCSVCSLRKYKSKKHGE